MAVCEKTWNDVGAHYAQAAAGSRGPSAEGHTVLVRSDGEVVAFGYNGGGRCDVPALPLGTQYVVPEMTEQNSNCSSCGDGSGSAPGC